MIAVAGHLQMDPADRDGYVSAFRDLVARARDTDGCIELSITADSVDPGRVHNFELWHSHEALKAFRDSADAPDTGVDIHDATVKEYVIARSRELFSED